MLLSWSGGKDAVLALHVLADDGPGVTGLMTTVARGTGRTGMHGLRPALVREQARALDLPLSLVQIRGDGTGEAYDREMRDALADREATHVAYADIALADVRAYREDLLEPLSLVGEWPLWEEETAALARACIDRGIHAIVVAVDGSVLPPAVLGRQFDEEFLADLPDDVDPCGENGEFHTFVRDAPAFTAPVPVHPGQRVSRERDGTPYHYLDLLPVPVPERVE